MEDYIYKQFEKESDVKVVLFLIGMRELGQKENKFSKEDKQDLMNMAVCKVFSLSGYFEVSHLDEDGWPVWKQAMHLPAMDGKAQESFIRSHIVYYFEQEGLI